MVAKRHRHGFLFATMIVGLISPALAQQAPPAAETSEPPPVIDVFPTEPPAGQIDAAAAAPVLTTLYAFAGGNLGYSPRGGVVMDAAGSIYGTTQYSGLCLACGIIYKLTRRAPGKTAWTFSIMHKFVLYQDGIHPLAPLTLFKGVIYGTTSAGGDTSCGCGTVFKITTGGAYTILHKFIPSTKGSQPIGGLLIDTDGTMYGTTSAGGKHGAGVIFKLTTAGGYSVLYDFTGSSSGPQGEMIFGKDGAIYGTTYGGGKYNQGAVFRITKTGSYQAIYDFLGVNQPGNSHDGANPEGRLALGTDGTIYGTTSFGGSPSGYGTAWSLKHVGTKWVYTQPYIFGSPGNLPHSGLVKGPGGAYFGTGAGGGKYQEGVIYKLVPPVAPSKRWTYKLLHSFTGRNRNGNIPYADLLYARQKFYGTNLAGGRITNGGDCGNGCGTVFQFTP